MHVMLPVEPMLARSTGELPDPRSRRGGYRYEPKWDGYRAISVISDQGHVHISSRHGTDLTTAFPEIADGLFTAMPRGTCVDGEICRWADGMLDFASLRRRYLRRSQSGTLAVAEPCHLIVFDLLELSDHDYRPAPLTTRRSALESAFQAVPVESSLALSMQTADVDVAREWCVDFATVGVEGIIAKPSTTPYLPGRSGGWLKYKLRTTTDAIVGGVTGSLARPRGLVLGRYDATTGRLRVVGSTTPLSAESAGELAEVLTPAFGDHPWPPRLALGWGRVVEYVRVEPVVVVEISADVATDLGRRWRHSVRFLRIRTDVTPDRVPLDLDLERRDQP